MSIQVLKDLTAYQTSDTDESVSLDERTARILESNERVLPILREVLTELPDQWDALETLVTVTFDSYVRSKRQEDFRLGDLRNELQHMQSAHSENRGPYLAELLLLQLWMEDKRRTGEVSPILPQCWSVTDESSLSEKFSELNLNSDNRTMIQELIYLLAQYILRYDTKQCCFTDIKPYLSLIDSQEYVHFLHWIRSRCDKIREKLLSNVHLARDAQSDEAAREVPEQICQISKLLQMEYYLKIANHQESDVDPWQFVRSLIDLYSVTHEVAGGKGVGGLREAQPGDELLMLASTVLKRQLLSFRNTVRSLPEVEYTFLFFSP